MNLTTNVVGLEAQLSINGANALRLLRALRRLPDVESTRKAERSAVKTLHINDTKLIALILSIEEER